MEYPNLLFFLNGSQFMPCALIYSHPGSSAFSCSKDNQPHFLSTAAHYQLM